MKKITLFKPYVSWLARLYALKVLCGTQLAEGPVVKCFEHEFGKRFGKRNVVAVNSGTSALELAYDLADIKPGDEVITPVLTCTATNLPLARRGAKIVFADINDTLNISIEDVESKITKRTKAIVFVHFGGNGSGLRQLLVLAKKHGIRVIEDAAQVVGAPSEEWGKADFTCISLQAIKTLTAGDGGFLICKDDADYVKAKKLRWFGYDRDEKQRLGDTDLELAGYKYHMNDISAAIGLGNLRRLDYVLKKRAEVRNEYRRVFQEVGMGRSGARLLLYPWLVILVHPHARAVDTYLKENDIGSGPYHYRNDKYSIFGRYDPHKLWVGAQPGVISATEIRSGRVLHTEIDAIKPMTFLKNMDRLENSYTLLPFHHGMSKKDVRRVLACSVVGAFTIEEVERISASLWREAIERYEYKR